MTTCESCGSNVLVEFQYPSCGHVVDNYAWIDYDDEVVLGKHVQELNSSCIKWNVDFAFDCYNVLAY